MIFHLLSSVCPEHVSLASVSQHLGINQLFFSTFLRPLLVAASDMHIGPRGLEAQERHPDRNLLLEGGFPSLMPNTSTVLLATFSPILRLCFCLIFLSFPLLRLMLLINLLFSFPLSFPSS